MKDLIKTTLQNGDFGAFQTLALVLFFLVMVGVIVWIHRPGSKDYYAEISKDALKGEDA
ncbi:cbb3-type cytochrome oxidase subunit 3 [Pseudobacteriovorax antillogorgiicola]|uniref:Cbb3-type cytochrome oxidase component FixQ n=1 Tax=Pseudobacteriovorax antillogorgiicola TaxID=1513793 RepID=A0A1Y6BKK1_9BACT|nr:cbb3-type cytochrome c oxidase subunit 3 [Pseudobacteriovorax antillogorgiicola]TCS56410.1 Cbb3-type cytochrome oxidase component FixQ [Pseudobacteriovorax antillogorgiicola]SMF05884.1 Cbb3-type cytochrome oxidase component FixQ [Pseudobacteriovorax antillogorgiicola]